MLVVLRCRVHARRLRLLGGFAASRNDRPRRQRRQWRSNDGFIQTGQHPLCGCGRLRAHLLGEPEQRLDRPGERRRDRRRPQLHHRGQRTIGHSGQRLVDLLVDDRRRRSVAPNIDGAIVKPAFISGPVEPCGVALDSGHVYWVDIASGTPAYIGRASLDGRLSNSCNTSPRQRRAVPCGVRW